MRTYFGVCNKNKGFGERKRKTNLRGKKDTKTYHVKNDLMCFYL